MVANYETIVAIYVALARQEYGKMFDLIAVGFYNTVTNWNQKLLSVYHFLMDNGHWRMVIVSLIVILVVVAFNKHRKMIFETETYINVWKTARRFFHEIWNNKILSLFYLIVMGANMFEFSKNVLGIQNMAMRIIVAMVVPVICVCVVVCVAVWIWDFFGHTKIVCVAKKAMDAFFEILDDDDHDEVVSSVRMTFKERAKYIAADYWASWGCIGVVAALKYLKFDDLGVTGGTIFYDFVVSLGFMVYSLRSGKDVTFGKGYRRAMNVIHEESRIIGWIGMILLNAKATIWDGPEQIPIYFEKELVTYERMVEVLFPLAVIQGIFWAWFYSYGYDSIFQAIRSI
jgi:hypothetical protein